MDLDKKYLHSNKDLYLIKNTEKVAYDENVENNKNPEFLKQIIWIL